MHCHSSLPSIFILKRWPSLIHICSLTLIFVKIVLRTSPVKFSLACAYWRKLYARPCRCLVIYLDYIVHYRLAANRQFINSAVKSLIFIVRRQLSNLILSKSVFTHISHANARILKVLSHSRPMSGGSF